jgi:NADH-quinone oxidoreductase subunit N
MGLFLLSFAGIPLTAGFIGKFVAFNAAIDAGAWPLVLIAVLASAAAAFVYVRVIVLMFLTPVPSDLEDTVGVTAARGPALVVLVAAVGTILLGIFPSPVLDLAHQAAILVP